MKLAYVLLAALSACIPLEQTDSVAQSVVCPEDWGCLRNSATVGDGLIFEELDSSGALPNRGGLRIVGAAMPNGSPGRVVVQRHFLVAEGFDGAVYTGSNLIGTIIRLKHASYGVYEVLVDDVAEQQLLFWAGAAEAVPFYRLKTRRLGELKFEQYACRYNVITDDPAWTGVQHSALVFQWDRYDPAAKTVSETSPGDPWFNVACAATAPAKLHLTRHTRAGSMLANGDIAYDTTPMQRQTMLKMLTADYCGKGVSFTIDGTPLAYRDANHWLPDASRTTQEALWSEDGALCLDTPRHYARDEIEAVCGRQLPACPSFTGPPSWESLAYVMSANR